MQVRKVVIPVAGKGTRFLPITKAVPKEMLPIFQRPAVHYIVQEALLSNAQDIVFITNEYKKAISEYFDSKSLDSYFNISNKKDIFCELNYILQKLSFNYITQSNPLGLGHAILMAKEIIKEDYFAVMLPDDIIFSDVPVLNQLRLIASFYNCSVIAVQEVDEIDTKSYGIIKIKQKIKENIFEVGDLVEKPSCNAPSNLAIIGRYILSKDIFKYLNLVKADNSTNEIQLTQALKYFVEDGNTLLACKFNGMRYDLGIPAGWFKANEYVSRFY